MKTSRKVYTTGVAMVDRAMAQDKPPAGADNGLAKVKQLSSVSPPFPSQKYTFQRGLAIAALGLPEQQRAMALYEALASMDLLYRIMPRHTKEDR